MIRQRVISAIIIAILLVGTVLWLPPRWSVGVLSMVLLIGAWEWSGFVSPGRTAARLLFLLAAVALAALWWVLSRDAAGLRAVLWGACASWCLATFWVFGRPQATSRATVVLSGLMALSFAWLAIARMRLDWPTGGYVVMYALLIVWLADSGAFFAGRRWGRRKLAPAVSPGKTWAGLWGGCAACVLLALVSGWFFDLPWLQLVVVTVVTGIFSVVGDLTESLCKRFAGVKDSGTLIPGHGGVLDRFDSLLAAAPILMLGFMLLPVLRG
ncbi:MAG: phosphatidate cytidylyltransferase [Steroidobacteraceae bacterium]